MSDTPLIIVLLKYFFKLLGYICSIAALPLTLFSLIISAIINADTKGKGSHFLICIPRILLVVPFWPSFPLLAYLYGWLISKAINDPARWVPFVISLGTLFAIGIGFWFTRFASFLKNSMPDLKASDYFKSLGEALLDFGAIIALTLSIGTVVRIPFLIGMGFTNCTKSIRKQLYLNMGFILLDILAFPIFLIELVTLIRIFPIFYFIKHKNWDNMEDYSYEVRIRLIIYGELFLLFANIFIIIFCFLFVISPWRIAPLFKNIKDNTSSVTTRRKQNAIFLEIFFGELECLLDWLCILCAILPVISIYRGGFLIYRCFTRNGKYSDSASSRRLGVFKEILLLLWDFICLLFMIPLVLTVYRLKNIFSGLTAVERANEIRFRICREFFYFLVDIPHIFMLMVILLTLWRSFFVIRDLVRNSDGHTKRRCIRRHFVYLFVDILDLPFVIIAFVILLTLWRAYAFVCGFITLQSRNKQRRYVFNQFLEWLLDIPTFVAFLFVLVTVYRFPECFRKLKEYHSIWSESPPTQENSYNNAPPLPSNDEDNPVPNSTKPGQRFNEMSWRLIILRQLLLVLIDIPIPLLLLLTLWRLPILIKRLKEITDPSRQYAQRRLLILRYLLYVALDIVCAPIVIFIFVTVWRIPTFVNMVKNYKRGDNEHKEIGSIFLRMLADIPFVILGACTLIFPWRGIFLIKSIYRESESDKESRMFALNYFGVCLLDIANAIVLIFDVCVGPWRIPTIIKIFNHYYEKERESPWVHTFSLTCGIGFSAIYILADYFGAIQALFIAIFIRQLPPFISAVRECSKNENFKLDLLRPILIYYSMETVKDIPHIALLPLKALGVLFLPVYYFMKKRKSTNIFQFPIDYFLDHAKDSLNYLGMDKIFVISVVGCLVIIPHELGLLIALGNCMYFFTATLGEPLWRTWREKIGWTKLGSSSGFASIIEIFILVIQVITFPAFVAFQGFVLMLPILISLGYYNLPNRPGFVGWWEGVFTSREFWKNAHRFNAGVWFFMVFWIVVNIAIWDHLYVLAKKYFPLFSPLKSYYWLVKKVFAGRIWGFYKLILAKSTNVCYRLRRVCFLGELLMFPLFLIWTCWSMAVPIATKVYYIFIPAGIISITLMVFAYRIIKDNWRSNPRGGSVEVSNVPVLQIQTVTFQTPEDGGIIFNFKAVKNTTHQQFTDIRLTLDGEALWDSIKTAIGSSKVSAGLFLVGYPIGLTPMFLDLADINKETKEVDFSIKIGLPGTKIHLKKKVLFKFVDKITKVKDAQFNFVLEFGKKDFGWKKHGIVCQFSTRLSELIRGEQNNGILYDNPEPLNIPEPPPQPNSYKNVKPRQEYTGKPANNNEIKPISPRTGRRNSIEIYRDQFGTVPGENNQEGSDESHSREVDFEVRVEEDLTTVNNPQPQEPNVHIFFDEETGEEIVLDDTVDERFKSNIV